MASFAARAEPAADGTLRVLVAGELDMATADPLLRVLVDAMRVDHACQVVVDLSEVSFLDATGIGVLLSAHSAALERGCRLRVLGAGGMVRKVLEITGVQEVLRTKADDEYDSESIW